MRTKTLIAGAVLVGVAMFIGGALAPLRSERARRQVDPISALRQRIDSEPTNAKLNAQLGLAYLQKARAEAESFVLQLAEDALTRSLELDPRDNLEAFIGMASLSNARHDFSHSVEWSHRAIDANPFNASAYGLLGDALFELGEFRAADAAYQQMVDRRPDVSSYVRTSYALQYRGKTRAAIEAMRLALKAAGPSGETTAWVRHQMGDIYAGLGDYRKSARHNQIGIEIAPGYVPPTVGLAESLIARDRLHEATEIMEVAAAELPALEYMIKLGELYEATGRHGLAAAQFKATNERLADYRANGVLPDADFIVFYADHGFRPQASLREAFAIYRNRPTSKTADALAWMLHAVGRDARAWRYARQALDSPTGDPSILFHAGMIAHSLDRDARAVRLLRQALKLTPNFSVLQAPVARRIVSEGIRSSPRQVGA